MYKYLLASLTLLPMVALSQPSESFRVLLGVNDSAQTRWDGTVSIEEGGPFTLQPWRFEGADGISGPLFHLTTHPARLFAGSTPVGAGAVVANGFIVTVQNTSENSQIKITTAQGDFTFSPRDLILGAGLYKLGGRAFVDRVPTTTQITSTPQEEDYPATATALNQDVWLTYTQFHHSPDYLKLRVSPRPVPTDFSTYKQATGGDQIWARKYSNGNWSEPIAVTKPGGDLYSPAVAIDGQNQAWIFWSENRKGNFDIYARRINSEGAPQDTIQISSESGSDIDPVAVRAADGKVWVAWQGWRNGRAAIFAAVQDGNKFSASHKVSESNADEWDPAIAADKSGHISIAWDSYRNGNYDIYARSWSGSEWGKEIPVAATARYEAYPSIAYDPNDRLWVAYEEGGKGWGKDFGAYSTPGVALYQGRVIRIRGIEPNGRTVQLDSNLDQALIGIPSLFADRLGNQSDSETLDPNPQNAAQRRPDQSAQNNLRAARNTLPRLTIDDTGRIFLGFRTAHPIWWSPLGTVWTEYLVSYDGKSWTRPIYLDHTDNLLDNRPAFTALSKGKLLIVHSSDNRRNYQIGERLSEPLGLGDRVPADPYENDLWSTALDLGAASQAPEVVSAAAQKDAPTIDRVDANAVQTLHAYRAGPNRNLQVVRGEFHRHSEVSMDGGGDGTLLDQWRYALDAAELDWVGCCDHDNGGGREYTWWITQKLTDIFHSEKFTPMFAYERSVPYPEGHRNVIFAERGIRPLPRLPLSGENEPGHAPDTQMLYAYLRQFSGVTASHTSATTMGTDWRDNDPESEPVVEIYQGDRQNYELPDAPRSNNEKDSIGGWRPKGFVSIALDKGYRLGFEASSDHISTHISYCNLLVKENSRAGVLEAFQKRHVYAATDNILADVESGDHLMGDEFSTSDLPSLKVKLKGTSRFAKVVIVKDGKYVYSTAPNQAEVEFFWRDNQPTKDKTAYYYVRGEQDNGEIVWVSPLWIKYTGQ